MRGPRLYEKRQTRVAASLTPVTAAGQTDLVIDCLLVDGTISIATKLMVNREKTMGSNRQHTSRRRSMATPVRIKSSPPEAQRM